NKAICSSDTGGWDLLPLAYGTSCNGGAGICDGDGSCMIAYGKITGYIDGAPSRAGQPRIVGWACAKYVARSIDVHVYAGGPAGSGTFVTAATANLASEPDVASACKLDGATALRFDIPISAALNYQLRNKKIYVHGISPIGGSNDLIGNSGVFVFPCPTSPPKLNLSYVNPGIMFNTPGITYCPYKFDDAVTTALQNFSIPPTDDHFHYVYSNFPYYLGTAA